MKLQEFAERVGGNIETVWYVSTAAPAGVELTNDTETDDDEDYFDLNEWFMSHSDWLDLDGSVQDDGRTWQWDGEGRLYDERGNSIVNVKVFAA